MADGVLQGRGAAIGASLRRAKRSVPKAIARDAFRRMLGLVWPHRRRMALGVALGMGVALTYAASLGGILPVLKVIVENANLNAWLHERAAGTSGWKAVTLAQLASIFPTENTPAARMTSLMILLSAIIALSLTGNVCRLFSQYLVLYSANRTVMDLRRKMYRKSLHVPMSALSGEVSNRVSQFMSDVREVYLGIGTLFGKFAREPLKALCVLIVAIAVDWRITLITLAIGPIAVGILWFFGRRIRKSTARMLEGYGMMLGSLEESLQGVDVVKGHGREGYERQRMWRLERAMLKQQTRLAMIEAVTSPLIEVIGLLLASGAIIWLASQTFSIPPQMDASHFATMVVLLAAMLDPVRKVANVYNMIQRAGAAAARIFEFLDEPEERSPSNARALNGWTARGVRFENVHFRYTPSQEPPALQGVSLDIRPGECVAIVGPNGSGKSTLLKLIPRLLDPQQGRVTLDSIGVEELSLRSLRAQVTMVTQRPVIFARSAAENIAYGVERATPEEIRSAAQRAFAAEFIEQWPERYETVLGEFGATLSGGQRQRLSIARAFLKPASVLIFDEATSEIDTESERKIHAALETLRLGKTTFLIAHRHTVMEMAERIVVMDAGQIVDIGTIPELLSRCPLFVALYRSPTTTRGRTIE